MAPPCHAFPASDLPLQVQLDVTGKKRKPGRGGGDVDLSKCGLHGIAQYNCKVENPGAQGSPVECWAVQRFFRQCKDKKGSFMVETTAWEDTNSTPNQSTIKQ